MGLFNKWCETNVVGAKLGIEFEWARENEVKVGKDAIYVSAPPVTKYVELPTFLSRCRKCKDPSKVKVVGVVSAQGMPVMMSGGKEGLGMYIGADVAIPVALAESLTRIKSNTKIKAYATVRLARMRSITPYSVRGSVWHQTHPSYPAFQIMLRDARVDRDSLDHALGIRKPRVKIPPKRKPTPRPKRTDEDKARSQLALSKNYIAAGLKEKAANVLKELIKKYPKTQAARTAVTELEKLDKK